MFKKKKFEHFSVVKPFPDSLHFTLQLLKLYSGDWMQTLHWNKDTTTLSIKLTGADLIFNNRPALVPEIGSKHQA